MKVISGLFVSSSFTREEPTDSDLTPNAWPFCTGICKGSLSTALGGPGDCNVPYYLG